MADGLYCKSTWIKEVLSIGMNALVRVKDERLHIVKDALALFKCQEADKDWTIKKNINTYRNIKAWDDDNFQMSDPDIEVRFIKFVEEIHTGDKIEIKR